MKQIAIVGAGELGSRHLQSLNDLCFDANILVIDPSEKSLEVARTRFDSLGESKKNIRYQTSFENIDEIVLDLVIVATGSRHRMSAIQNIIKSFKVKNMVLEKVLFTSLKEYEKAGQIFNEKGINVWVNCPRRMYPFYKTVKEKLNNNRKITLKIEGQNWGMACNSIHYIDLVNFLSESPLISISNNELLQEVFESKRKSYIELYGKISGQFENGSKIDIVCDKNNVNVWKMTIGTGASVIDVFEVDRKMIMRDENGNEEVHEINIPFQSQLSSKFTERIIKEGKCDLVDFNTSRRDHEVFIGSLLSFYKSITKKNVESIPIT